MVFGFGKKAAPPAAKAANATKKNQPTSNKRMVTYKVFKGYTPKAKRSTFSRRNLRNTVWDLASEDPKPSDATFTAALARYQELDKKAKKTPLEEDEYNTLKLLLHHYKKTKPLTPNSFKSILPLVYTEEGLASRNAASIAAKAASPIVTVNDPTPRGPNAAASRSNANTGDPTNINGTIQRMKCTVCESQSIIDKALNPGEAPRKCDICGAKAVVNDIGNVSNIHNYLNELPNPPIADYKSKTPANIPANAPNPPIAAYKSKTLANIPANAPNPPIAAYKSKTPANVPANAPNPPIAAYKSKTPANAAVPSTNPFNIPGPLPTPNTSNNPFNQFNNKNESKNVKGYYKILGLKSSASNDDIRKAYHNMLLKWHPNKNPPNKKNEATEMTKKIMEAHEILNNNDKRKQYNKSTRKNRRN